MSNDASRLKCTCTTKIYLLQNPWKEGAWIYEKAFIPRARVWWGGEGGIRQRQYFHVKSLSSELVKRRVSRESFVSREAEMNPLPVTHPPDPPSRRCIRISFDANDASERGWTHEKVAIRRRCTAVGTYILASPRNRRSLQMCRNFCTSENKFAF